ncbi:aminotransferase class I/II-fold pyridoxal phosphate-dependent enzyme [Neolewinella lacunae]|uniref:Aminotransferase class I/II-fold pyridoxal phosphate-dependent enzyme n=1 Tax=Neolewinella lacunae TaxID=1517758 RepID=A0A923PMB9_9BACT|nr:aminotransferase class I/II-fold pyridoxal phosphate-dependent enzyme [Neolewinella lacunae]MBC6993919.1 aminotransferase class I/II-fold pyridoxal phosphate-dependent enzyme [Neolewinella lacunae]MDN3635000.1 aminotransferase class I/II-fold pyridoxal phosphate-dependent enzyme [Neolewinella lacunae]
MADFLQQRLAEIAAAGTWRTLGGTLAGVDFWSNDYLGLARTQVPGTSLQKRGETAASTWSGATGSRSISGDAAEWHGIEADIAAYHGYPTALVFNSGYTANLGLLSALVRRTDTLLYDELVHASCRDGIRLGLGKALRFPHNDLLALERLLAAARPDGQRFVLTESRFSMDGDLAPLPELAGLCARFGAQLIVDEAHSGGLEGRAGAGLVASHGLQDQVFATIITYGKAFGTHGGAVLGSQNLREYLINTCRPFIYTTGPAPDQWYGIAGAYAKLANYHASRYAALGDNIAYFRSAAERAGLGVSLSGGEGPIQIFSTPGNAAVLAAEAACRRAGLLVKGIRSPTVAAGAERLRICLHAYNTAAEMDALLRVLAGLGDVD